MTEPSSVSVPTPTAPRAGRRRRWVRRLIIAAIVLGGGWALVTRSFLTRWVAEAAASSRLGVPVRADSVMLGMDGRIVVHGLRVMAGAPGEAGRFAEAATIVVRTPWWRAAWSWAAGAGPAVSAVEVDGLVVRVSQSVEDGSPNIPAFRIAASGSGGPLPRVEITGGRVEFGEHEGGAYRVLRTLGVRGDLRPGSAPETYEFDLRQPGTDGLVLSGFLDSRRVSAKLRGLLLDSLEPSTAPTPVRELFRKMDLAGRVTDTTFEYTFPAEGATAEEKVRGIDATIGLDKVAVTLPFEDLESQSPAGQRRPRMHGVDGRIRVRGGEVAAEFAGMLEDLPYTVSLNWHGASVDAPFESVVETNGFRLASNPRLLPFLPKVVHKRLAMFSNPSGIVDSRVVLTRARAGEQPKVSGTIEFREGVASFVRFPYEFRGMTGLFEFNADELRIVRVHGKADTGAELTTTGRITPLTDEAATTLLVTVTNVPVDEKLAEGLGPRRRGVLDALFNREREAELLKAGLIVTPEEAAKRAAALASARERLAGLEAGRAPERAIAAAREAVAAAEASAAVPAFTLGGRGNVVMSLETPFGRNMPWTQVIDIDIPSAGLLPRRFPLPILARDVKLKVDDTVLRVEGGSFSALRGGEATVSANADFSSEAPEAARPGETAKKETDIRIDARRVPFDDLLIHAIPSRERPVGSGAGADARTLGGVLSGLKLRGAGDASVWIGDVAPGEIGFTAEVTFTGATCSPGGAAPMLSDVGGKIEVADESLRLAIKGSVPPADGRGDSSPLSVDLSAAFPHGSPPSFDSLVAAAGLDAAVPVERAIDLFSPQGARSVAALRRRYDPAGRVDVRTTVKDDGKAPMSVEVRASNGRDVRLTYAPELKPGSPPAPPARIEMGPWRGGLTYRAGDAATVEFSSLSASLTADGIPSGTVLLEGMLNVSEGVDGGRLGLSLEGARFESSLTRAVAAERLSPEFATFLHERNPRGVFGLNMTLNRPAARDATPWDVEGELRPSSLSIHGETVDVEAPSATGLVRFHRDSGTFQGIKLATSDWTAGIDGHWALGADGSSSLRASIEGRAQGLAPSLMSLMPAAVRDMAGAVKAGATGAVTFEDVDLQLSWPAGGKRGAPGFRVTGLIGFEGASADLGVELKEGRGSVNLAASRDAAGVVEYHATAGLDSVKAAGVVLAPAKARLDSGQNPGETLVPTFQGGCHGGWVSGDASVKPLDPAKPDGLKAFSVSVDFADVKLAGLLGDFSGKPGDGEDSASLEGNATLGGIVNDPSSRRGRGQLSAGGGAVIDMPVMLPLIQFSNLQIPTGERLDTALAWFYVDGPTIAMERISVLSPSIELRGFGTVTLPGMDLNLVFNSTSNAGWLKLLSQPIEILRDTLVTTVIRGTAKNPKISLEPLRSARQMFSGMFSESTTDDIIMSGLESRRGRNPGGQRVVPLPQSGESPR